MLNTSLLLLDSGLSLAGASVGAGIIVLGVGIGIGNIGSSAVEAVARQPEEAGKIQKAMIIAAALIEGVALFSTLICLIIATK
jgi:F-type H+-transporting ATPase subunit c